MKKNITVAVSVDTYDRARIWAAKHMATLSRIVDKTLRKIAEQTETDTPPTSRKTL